ncbi:MAG: hypothetical protein ACKOCM_04615 [Cyanobacteriota bacterium]
MSFLLYCLAGCQVRRPRGRRVLPLVLLALMGCPPVAVAAPATLLPTDPALLMASCRQARAAGSVDQLRRLRQRLLQDPPSNQPFAQLLLTSEALLDCQAPAASLQVLDGYGPLPGAERRQWLVQQWRAASAGLDHARAAQALLRLSALEGVDLETFSLPVGPVPAGGRPRQRPALDLLAEDLESLGRSAQAAALLLAARSPGELRAHRLRRGVMLSPRMELAERDRWLETALEEAAAAGAWSLASELLDDQVLLHLQAGEDPSRAVQRRLRLSQRLDDAYGEWRLRRHDPLERSRAAALEKQLRSPSAPGGHAVFPAPRSPLP